MILENEKCIFRPGLQVNYELQTIVERDGIPLTFNGGITSRPTNPRYNSYPIFNKYAPIFSFKTACCSAE